MIRLILFLHVLVVLQDWAILRTICYLCTL